MKTTKLGIARRFAAVSMLAAGMQLVMTVPAYAVDADILRPKMSEFVPALIAFAVIWLILAKLAWPMIMKTLDAREEKIEADLKAAEDAKVDAATQAQAVKDATVAAQSEAAEIVAAAKREAEDERTRIIAEAQTSAQNIAAKAREAVNAEREKAMVELSGQVVDLSVEIAGKIIGDALSVDEQRKLAEKYLMEVGSLNGNE